MKKLTYNYVKNFIEDKGYKLLSEEYINALSKLNIVCPDNHIFQIKFNDFQQGHGCSICSGTKRLTYNYVKNFIENEKYQVISTTYKNNKLKLDIKCDKNHEFKMNFCDFQQGHRCPICFGTPKLSYNYVKSFIEKENYTLFSTEYININEKLKTKCKNNHIYQVRFNDFKKGSRCPICSNNRKYTYEQVKNHIEQNNYRLISTEYINNHSKLSIKCNKNHIFDMDYSHFLRGQRCPICKRLSSKPENEIFTFTKNNYDGIILKNDRTQLKNPLTNRMLELDVFLPDMQKAIEFNGKHWHSDNYQQYKDNQKIIQCKDKNIDLLIIEEKDWITNKENCLSIIKNFIK